jgi:S-DNA-T family DNA segregation ATPase FtsK/SpoIIIE
MSTLQAILDQQADIIENVLRAHKITARVWGGVVTPRFVRYELTTAADIRLNKVLALKDEVAMMLGVSDVRMYRKNGAVYVEAPRTKAGVVKLLAVNRSLKKLPLGSIILGVDEEGAPLLLRLTGPDVAHILVAGSTGSGKTVLLRSMILSLALRHSPRTLRMLLIDPKGRGFGPLADLPHLTRPVVTRPEQAIEALASAVTEMEARDREQRNRPLLIVAIDELADLRMVGGKQVEHNLTRLTQRGREAGVHVIVATQRPASTIMGGLVKANLPVRLVGAVASPEDAKVATGVARSGAERLRGRGDFLLVARGETVRFQAAYVAEAEIRAIARRMATRTPGSTG